MARQNVRASRSPSSVASWERFGGDHPPPVVPLGHTSALLQLSPPGPQSYMKLAHDRIVEHLYYMA